jgi:hypothetical protein
MMKHEEQGRLCLALHEDRISAACLQGSVMLLAELPHNPHHLLECHSSAEASVTVAVTTIAMQVTVTLLQR